MTKTHVPYVVGIDAGGTMTDCVIVDQDGNFVQGKSLTNPGNETKSYMDAVRDTAENWGLGTSDVHKNVASVIYCGTTALNPLLTGVTKKVGLLMSRGFEHTPRVGRTLTWLGQSLNDIAHITLHTHAPMLVDMKNVKPITERIGGGSLFLNYQPGKVLIPLNEQEVRKATEELIDAKVDSIGICYFNSYANPAHEFRSAEIARQVLKERGSAIPVICSYDVCSTMRMDGRLQDLLVECLVATQLRENFRNIERATKQEGYKHDVLTLLAYGGSANTSYPRMYEASISGPIGGVIAAKHLGEVIGARNLMTSDLGGTSWDVGTINDGNVEIKREADFAGRRFNLPIISIASFFGGTGAHVTVDEHKRIALGPDSAGPDVGVCFRSENITVADCDLVLGYLNPDSFLGGKIKLDKKKAERILTERLAKPLGMSLHDAATGIVRLLNSSLKDNLNVNLSNRGFNFSDYVLLVYGGGGPLHAWGAIQGLPFKGVVSMPWAATFSAFGGALSDYIYRRHMAVSVVVRHGSPAGPKMEMAAMLNAAWQECDDKILEDFRKTGLSPGKVKLRRGIYARYIGQLESWEAKVEIDRVETPEDMDKVLEAFERAYAIMFPKAASLPRAGYVISEVYAEGLSNKAKPTIPKFLLKDKKPDKGAYKGKRDIYHDGKWTSFDILDVDKLHAGNRVDGPAVIEHSMTTWVIPPELCIDFDEYRLMWYRSK